MTDQRIVWVDLETGGLDPFKHQIIQLAAVATDTDLKQIGDPLEVKVIVEPRRVTQEALDMNSYDPEDWRDAVSPTLCRKLFTSFLRDNSTVRKISKRGKAYTVAALGGHNVQFDVSFLRHLYADLFFPADYHTYDTMAFAQCVSLVKGVKFENLKLVTLAEHYGVSTASAHDALADIQMTVEVARHLLGELLLGQQCTDCGDALALTCPCCDA